MAGHLGWRRHWKKIAVFLMVRGVLGVGSAQRPAGGGVGAEAAERMRAAETMARQRRLMVHEADTLLLVATDLSVELGNRAMLPVKQDADAWRRAETIERLAHNVRLRMMGATR